MKKLNWGTSIVIAFVLFIGFILFFVIKTNTNSKYDHDLVSEEYYKDELAYQKQIDKLQNYKDLTSKIKIENTNLGVTVIFPEEFNPEDIKGKISLYRPSNQILDSEIPLSLSNSSLLIPKKVLVGGRWDIYIDWSHQDTEYLFKTSINY